jgi:hypothetical protein
MYLTNLITRKATTNLSKIANSFAKIQTGDLLHRRRKRCHWNGMLDNVVLCTKVQRMHVRRRRPLKEASSHPPSAMTLASCGSSTTFPGTIPGKWPRLVMLR